MRTKELAAELAKLSCYEIVTGMFLYLSPETSFPEQKLLRFFHGLQRRGPKAFARFGVEQSGGQLRSITLRQILDYQEMAKTVKALMPNPVDQYYEIRRASLEALRKDLAQRRVVPRHEPALQELAGRFQAV